MASEEPMHDWRVTTDASAAATDTTAFLKALRTQEGAAAGTTGAAAAPAAGGGDAALTSKDAIKVILLGDSAVGKSKLVERFLMDGYEPQTMSTFALTLYRYNFAHPDGRRVAVDVWDTAGQERFQNLHPSFFHRVNAAILAFDVTRKVTYKNLDKWFGELQEHSSSVPCVVVANKIDIDYAVTQKSFAFPAKHNLPFYFVSAADGTNVVKAFTAAIMAGVEHKARPADDFFSEVLEVLSEDL